MNVLQRYPLLCALLLGALCVFGFAPFYVFLIPLLALAGLAWLWQRAESAKQAGLLGLLFGLGYFTAGIHWIEISLHDVGGMPAWMAVLATLGLCSFLALFHGAAGYWILAIQPKLKASAYPLLLALIWASLEWVREWLFTGFPWLAIGYSQIPNSPLASLAPLTGVLGVSFASAYSAACLPQLKRNWPMLLGLWLSAGALGLITWTQPSGSVLALELLQGNVAQSLKWQAQQAEQSSAEYYAMAKHSRAQLIVLPETALPYVIEADQIDQHPVSGAFQRLAQTQQKTLLIGTIEKQQGDYFNSVLALSPDAPVQRYRKSHLVPFGEFIPFPSLLAPIYQDWLHIPMSDLSRGNAQTHLQVLGVPIAVNICYEDVFGQEIRQSLPQAQLLINVSNDAWYGHSIAAAQHLQFSQARALENGRWLLRATNTGVTAAINTRGQVVAQLAQFTQASLPVSAPAYQGSTPYSRYGNTLIFSLMGLAVVLLWVGKNK